jgi:hypothetical protein
VHRIPTISDPKNVIPFGIKTKKVLTIHDLAYYMPQFDAYKMTDTLYMKFMIKSSVKRADKVVAISNNTKKDIENILKTPKEKISVIYEATNSNFRVIKDKKALEEIIKSIKANVGDLYPRIGFVFNHAQPSVLDSN